MRVFSIVGLIPLCATASIEPGEVADLPELGARIRWFLDHKPEYAGVVGEHRTDADGRVRRLLSLATPEQLARILVRMLDTEEFLSPYGLRSVSRYHLEHPFAVDLGGQRVQRRLRAGRVPDGQFRRQLQLARPGLDAEQLPDHRCAAGV